MATGVRRPPRSTPSRGLGWWTSTPPHDGRWWSKLRLEDQPLRAEFLSLDQLQRHGQALANWHQIATRPRGDHLLPRLAENERFLNEAYELVNQALIEGGAVAPAAEWLLDNFYLIENQMLLARQHLPRKYSLELPQLAGGPADGYPRVYDLAMELISHADGLLDAENLRQFLAAYQSVSVLSLGELWAIPIMLRLALIENLRRVAVRIALHQRDRGLATAWADRVVQTIEHDPKSLILVLADLIREQPPLSSSFVAEYTQRLQGRIGQFAMALSWLEHRLAEQGQTVDQLIALNSQSQAADQVSIGNSITSLRSLGALDWRAFVEEQSAVERVLSHDPEGSYLRMDFASRDRYRHVVERIAKRSPRREDQVARVAIELAQQAQRKPGDGADDLRVRRERVEPDHHVGYYLVDVGRPLLEQSVGYRPSPLDRARRWASQAALGCYLGGVGAVTLAVLGWALAVCWPLSPFAWLWPLLALTCVASQFGVTVANWVATRIIRPRTVMRLDFSEGLPADMKTLVAIPTLLTNQRAVESLLEGLEVRFLANRDPRLCFALLTDLTDADSSTRPEDEPLIERARRGVEALNAKYASERPNIFFLMHRPRTYCASEGAWMGRERKRGKLGDLNEVLRGGRTEAFSAVVGDLKTLANVRYVITLDTDTQLPRDAAASLVGCMAHPLNRPRFDEAQRRVVRGHALLQPRAAVTLPDAQRTLFSRLFAGQAGIDPYTLQVSDVYQDAFDEGSFIGKGIYDVTAFESVLRDRFPDSRILSHDLLEGCYLRSGLINDVELFEGFPGSYLADMSRRHRWVRGDWQIASWLSPIVPTRTGTEPNPLTWLSRWKLFDNLRRSLVAPATLALLLTGWMLTPQLAGFWTLLVVALTFMPMLLMGLPALLRIPEEMPWKLHVRHHLADLGRQGLQGALTLAVLPYEAHCHADAILRTLTRLLITRRRLLEWTTASDAERRAAAGPKTYFERMHAAPVIALSMLAGLIIFRREALPAALPLLIAWMCGPALAWKLAQRARIRADAVLPDENRRQLRRIARRTWRFFETFVTERDHWLPPDNFQEQPGQQLATRTSPTNIGLGLLVHLAAHDFGYLSITRLLERLTNCAETLQGLERHRGHFFNWYDTRSLAVIEPRYISSVDSGNLAGLLLVLQAGLEDLPARPVLRPALAAGLHDTLAALLDAAAEQTPGQRTPKPVSRDLARRIARLQADCAGPLETLQRAQHVLTHFAASAAELATFPTIAADPVLAGWNSTFEAQCRDLRDELLRLAPWSASHPALLEGMDRATSAEREVRERLVERLQRLERGPSLNELASESRDLASRIDDALSQGWLASEQVEAWRELALQLRQGADEASRMIRDCLSRAEACEQFARMDFQFLYDKNRDLLSIGFNVTDHRLDASFYDLLASESRLASFVAVAQHQLPQQHWFALGRMLTTQDGEPTLLSWSGSMFEYLMPMLVMPTYEATLLDLACSGAVKRQIQYGRQRGVPWGISESCYSVTDVHLTYQYRAFGVPGLGLQRGLGDDLVIAPYATVLAAMVDPLAACRNLVDLEKVGALGEYGLFDAVDYTPARRTATETPVCCRTYMAHHSGMSFLALDAVLNDSPMQARFLQNPLLRAHDLLLQERVPNAVRPVYPHAAEAREHHAAGTQAAAMTLRSFDNAEGPIPDVQLLSNGSWHVLLTTAGAGGSRWRDLAMTRWQPDQTRDADGQFCYVRDARSGAFWSTTFQPTARTPQKYHVVFSQGRGEYRVVHEDVDAHTLVSVSSEDDVEVRRVSLKNLSRVARTLELTTYAEVVLAPPHADAAHRAFSNLFVQTEILPDRRAIICQRRPRTPHERPLYLFHLLIAQGQAPTETSYETDRAQFIGRGRDLRHPACFDRLDRLSGTAGAVLDPIVAIRQLLQVEPDSTVRVDIVTGGADSREAALALIEKYQDHRLADRTFELAWTHSQVVAQQLGVSAADVQLFSRLAGSVVYGGPQFRANTALISQNRRSQSGLWAYGISGDYPIVLVRVSDLERLSLVRGVLQAHAYWRLKGLTTDLVIWNDDFSGYRQQLQDALMALVASGPDAQMLDRPGGVFIRRAEQFAEEDRILLQTAARVVLTDAWGSLAEQLERRPRPEPVLGPLTATRGARSASEREAPPSRRDLLFFNGWGGFTQDGKEYVMQLRPGQPTPAPWCNVLANDRFGTVVSESGLGYTWSENAHEFRLSAWHNDPVSDPCGEALYVRDEETGRIFSPTPAPARGTGTYVCRHGFGYSVWEYAEGGLSTELWAFVAADAPVKFLLLKLKNTSSRRRSLSVTGYVEWVLGEMRDRTSHHVVTEIDPQSGALFARNAYHNEFGTRVAFFQCSGSSRSVTCDRTEFVGRNGSLASPAALGRTRLSGKAGAALDPCSALMTWLELGEGEEHELVFVLGAAESHTQATSMLLRFQAVGDARRTLERVWSTWNQLLHGVQVETPDAALNVLANGWLMYQTLASRYWGRSGFYQSGGAYGFRDQLQDTLALLFSAPYLTREHLLRSATRQFREGDVQHWWHPPGGRGVRTRIRDDYLWLPYVAARYVEATGDTGVLDERMPFLSARLLAPDEESYYDLPQLSEDSASLYEHCRRAIEFGMKCGPHGLPLMGSGDWNDGMNLVGIEGRGESVWLAFFMYDVLMRFAGIAARRQEQEYADELVEFAQRLRLQVEQAGWDGAWYRRAYFDNGQPLGSAANTDCQIDSLPQSWSVLSRAAPADRSQQALQSVYERLVDREGRLIRLFTPPFDQGDQQPGYVRGYVPGVRENGGQYTHAAVWATMAFAALGDTERAWECFQLINPVLHSSTSEEAARYRVEPYVVAGDVYSMPPHVGRGGWTWYTGSSGWMYRLIIEQLLGLRVTDGVRLTLSPCVPLNWGSYRIHYRFHSALYHLHIKIQSRPTHQVARLVVDGEEQPDKCIMLRDDGREHQVEVTLGIE